jgi:hypothetical protein
MTNLINTYSRIALVVISVVAITFSAAAQERKVSEKDVPAGVIAAFKSAYPTAMIKGYAREKEKGQIFYEIESKEGDIGRDVLYKPDGSLAEIEETVGVSDLPTAAQKVIHSKYPGATVTKAEKTTEKSAQGDKVGYEVTVRQGKKRFSLEFDGGGNLKRKGK